MTTESKHTSRVEQATAQFQDMGHQANISVSEQRFQQMISNSNRPSTVHTTTDTIQTLTMTFPVRTKH